MILSVLDEASGIKGESRRSCAHTKALRLPAAANSRSAGLGTKKAEQRHRVVGGS